MKTLAGQSATQFESVNTTSDHPCGATSAAGWFFILWRVSDVETTMKPATAPSKEQVRNYTNKRREAKTPPPTPEQVRRELGWNMLPAGDKR